MLPMAILRDIFLTGTMPLTNREACYAFILRGDKKLIREYISRHQLSPSGEYALLSLLDIDLIVYYEKLYGFSDYDVLTDLGL